MNEGLNTVTLVDGECPRTTPYTLATDEQKAAVTGFIVKTDGKPRSYWGNLTEREMLHPVYGDFPRLLPGEPIPTKPELLEDVDGELYENFVRDIMEEVRRDDVEFKALMVVCLPLLVVGMVLPNENVGFSLVLGAIIIFIIATIYEFCTKRHVVKEYKPAFARHGIEVAEVSFFSDFYTTSYRTWRDLSTYVVFSVAGSREKLEGEGQFDFLPNGAQYV